MTTIDLTVISLLNSNVIAEGGFTGGGGGGGGGQQLHLLKSENTLKMIQSVKNLDGSVCP